VGTIKSYRDVFVNVLPQVLSASDHRGARCLAPTVERLHGISVSTVDSAQRRRDGQMSLNLGIFIDASVEPSAPATGGTTVKNVVKGAKRGIPPREGPVKPG